MSADCLDRKENLLVLALGILYIVALMHVTAADPVGANITSASVENFTPQAADAHTAAGGSFTTLLLNVTSQTSSWKAYVGNVSGRITLDNSQSRTIYDWSLTRVMGEVYVSRNNSVAFTSLACANDANITAEHVALNISGFSDDSINNTFKTRIHRSFVIGGTGTIANSTCYAVATFVNDTVQTASENASFQEILLSDTRNLVWVTLLENRRTGFDAQPHDFQIILPDQPSQTSTTYYFYAELG